MKTQLLIFILSLLGCTTKTPSTNNGKEANVNVPRTDTIPSIYLKDLKFNTVTRWFYGDSIGIDSIELKNGDTVVYGRIKNSLYEPDGWIDEYILMRGSLTSEYKENGITKSAVFFVGDNYYQHGHTWSMIQVLFFEKEKDRWKFLDSVAVQDFDVGMIQEINLCNNGLSVWFKGEWANMGAMSGRETFLGFQNEELVVDLSFWTYSARMRDEEPFDLVEEDTAQVVIKENPHSEWNSIYYYSMRYDCDQKDAEDDLSFCSSKWVFEKDDYQVYALKKSERKRK